MRPGAFSTLITTNTGVSSLIVGANSIDTPTTWTGGIKAGSAALTSGLALDGGSVPTHGLHMPSATPSVTTDTLYNNSAVLTWPAGGFTAFGVHQAQMAFSDSAGGGAIILTNVAANRDWDIRVNTANNLNLDYYNGSAWANVWGLTTAGALTVASGITAGSGAVGIVDATGKIPAISSTYFASLSGANLTGIPTSAVSSGNFVATVASGTGITSSVTSGNAAATTISLNNTAVSASSYGSSTAIPSFTVDAQGRLTAATTNAVIAPAGTLTGNTLAAGVTASSLTSVGTLTGGATGSGFTVALSTSTVTGTLADARLSANVPLLNANNAFTGYAQFVAAPAKSWYATNSPGAMAIGPYGAIASFLGPQTDILQNLYIATDGNLKYTTTNGSSAILLASDGSGIILQTAPSGTVDTTATLTSRFSADASGNVSLYGGTITSGIWNAGAVTTSGSLTVPGLTSTTTNYSLDGNGGSVQILNNGTANIATSAVYCWILISETQSVGANALVASAGATALIYNGGSAFSAASGTGGKINVYNSSSSTVTVENKTGGTITIKGFVFRGSAS